MSNLTEKEKLVLRALFKEAQSSMSRRGCNDVERDVQGLMSKEEWSVLFKEIHEANEKEPYDGENYLGANWLILGHLFEKLFEGYISSTDLEEIY